MSGAAVERIHDLIDEYGRAAVEVGRSDMSIGYDPGRHYKNEECDSAKAELFAAIAALTAELQQCRQALEWIVEIADKNYEQDATLRANGARTLLRIGDKARAALKERT